MKNLLLDANSLVLLMKTADVQTQIVCLQNSFILDLTFYEVGNAIYKDTCLTKFITKTQSQTLQKSLQVVLAKTEKIACDPTDFQKISEISEEQNLSFYDASYLFAAKQRGLTLVTEDKKLRSKAEKQIDTKNLSLLQS